MSVPAVRVIVAKVWRLVWKVTSLLIPARFAMVFKALLAAPSFGALGKTNWSLASFGLCGLSGILLSIDLPRIPVINYIGQHSMVFFVAHYPMLILYKLIRSANVHSIRQQWDDYTILLIIIFSLCFLLVPHVEKVPWLSGRFKRRAAIRYRQSQAIQTYDGREGSYGHKG